MHFPILKYRPALSLIAAMLLSAGAMSQQVPSELATRNHDTTTAAEDVPKHSLYAGLGGGSNMIYLGSTISQDQPFLSSALTYGFKNELFVSASANHLSDRSPFLAFYNFSANYLHTVNSWFDFSLGLYRYQVVPSLADTLFGSFNYADAAVGFDWKILYTTVSFGGILAKNGGSYLQIRNSRYFETTAFMKGKATVSIDPYINLLFGTLITIETTEASDTTRTHPGRPVWKGPPPGLTSPSTSYTRKFGAMEADFGLPVAFSTDVITVEAEAGYVLPVYTDPDYPGIKGFVFLLSVYFRIF
jgi:hypothetical protein